MVQHDDRLQRYHGQNSYRAGDEGRQRTRQSSYGADYERGQSGGRQSPYGAGYESGQGGTRQSSYAAGYGRGQGAGQNSYQGGYEEGQGAGRNSYRGGDERSQGRQNPPQADYERQSGRRNPYLADYEQRRNSRMNRRQETGKGQGYVGAGSGVRRQAGTDSTRKNVDVPIPMYAKQADSAEVSSRGQAGPVMPAGHAKQTGRRPVGQAELSARRPNRQAQSSVRRSVRRPERTMDMRRSARVRRRRRMIMQRVIVALWVLCVVLLSMILIIRGRREPTASGNPNSTPNPVQNNGDADKEVPSQGKELFVQGLSAVEFARHPEWTEDFLTPNEYSRPGDALESVKNIFVHYTANPGTSAAQNRSYFERQKDEHKSSVSSHFIIGYEGEIIQCVPLDEVAYAVKSRNYDSISIECCHLEKDGSFTQETYDSLISLLAWLIDVYDLKSEDILRHYDCGGKKCPLYYTEHPDAWEQLKKDVDNF